MVTTLVALIFFLQACSDNRAGRMDLTWIASCPAADEYTGIDREGVTVLPNGRFITPYGKTLMVAPHPYGLILGPDNNVAVTANSGSSPLSVSIIRNVLGPDPIIQQVPEGVHTERGILESVFMGLAIHPGKPLLYVAGGQDNKVYIFDIESGEKEGEIDCSDSIEGRDYSHGYIGDMVLSVDGSLLYAVDQINFRMLVIETGSERVVKSIAVGRYPFGIALSPDEKEVYVANVGMYEYKWIPGVDPEDLLGTGLSFPPFAFQSEESINGIQTDTLEVPGLGDPNDLESFSVWCIDAASGEVTGKIKTGFLVGEKLEDFPAVGGSSPNSLVATENFIFVSNGNNDCVSVINRYSKELIREIFLRPEPRLSRYRGVIPFGLALSPDHRRLYVAEAGINAVGVIDVPSLELVGHIPAGWFPSKLAVSSDGRYLLVANAKGYGSGPNAGENFEMGPEGSYIGGLMKGSVSVMQVPGDRQLKKLTRQVLDNNVVFSKHSDHQRFESDHPVPLFPGHTESPIKHIVFISKENRTYDEVFGQVKEGRGDPSLARYGYDADFQNWAGDRKLENITVMPNHLELARRFAISDNFYVDSDFSADGHRWLVCTYPNEWVETGVAASYGGNRDFRIGSRAPGNFAFVGASGAIYPEDYNEAGSIWEHMDRNNISFWNFGFGTMFAPHITDDPSLKMTGYLQAVNYPVPAPMFDRTSRTYPTYNTSIPDQFRADRFIEEFTAKWLQGKDSMPAVLTIIIGNDHGAGERPEEGYPFRESYMADNDLALGRIVEFLSHTPYWKNTAIVVTEDDSQGGVDHIDAHRSILMVISPYAKKNYVSHAHSSFGSIFKTFWNILGIPYLNQYDATASDLSDMFTEEPDMTPYSAISVETQMFDPDKAYDPLDEEFNWESLADSPVLDHPEYLKQDSEIQDSLARAVER